MNGTNEKSHEKSISKLNDMHLSSNDWCPKSVEAAMTYVSHHMDDSRSDKSRERIQLMQQRMHKYQLCQEEGHKTNKCPHHEKER